MSCSSRGQLLLSLEYFTSGVSSWIIPASRSSRKFVMPRGSWMVPASRGGVEDIRREGRCNGRAWLPISMPAEMFGNGSNDFLKMHLFKEDEDDKRTSF